MGSKSKGFLGTYEACLPKPGVHMDLLPSQFPRPGEDYLSQDLGSVTTSLTFHLLLTQGCDPRSLVTFRAPIHYCWSMRSPMF